MSPLYSTVYVYYCTQYNNKGHGGIAKEAKQNNKNYGTHVIAKQAMRCIQPLTPNQQFQTT